MYSVVHFVDDETVDAVPSVWIKGKFCAWPNNKACVVKYIQNKRMPNDIDFSYFKARVLRKNIGNIIMIIVLFEVLIDYILYSLFGRC